MTEPLFQARPERPGWPRYDIDLASSELPCGAAWLVNCLLELGIPAWKAWGADDDTRWHALGNGRFRYVGGDDGWRRVLPALRDGREFEFHPGRCVRAHHAWPGVFEPAPFSIFFARDPRDALLSAWHRQRALGAIASETDFAAFLALPYGHYPLSWLQYTRLFLRVWQLEAARRHVHIARFEDYRADAVMTLRTVLDHVDIAAPAGKAATAADASSIERVRGEDRRLVEQGIVAARIVRGVAPGEYRDALDPEMRHLLDEEFAAACDWLGYAHDASATQKPIAAGMGDAIFDAIRQTGVCVRADDWLAGAITRALDERIGDS